MELTDTVNLFYPSHDIALSNGVRHFNPPQAAWRLQEDLAPLSALWQREGSDMPIAWGWDYDTRALLNKEYKIRMKHLPSDEELEALRTLSSRTTTIDIIDRLKQSHDEFCNIETPLYLDSEEALKTYIDAHDNFVIKTPWSSSGRGLSISKIIPKASILKHCIASIKKMGGVIAEPWYDKVQDFAMLFYVGKEKVEFIGYSLFDNDDFGTYRCGRLISNERIEASLPSSCLIAKEVLPDMIHQMFGQFMHKTWEVGYIGIDMMVFKTGTSASLVIHPCVEMNLRCTMGVVARQYFDHNLMPQQTGQFYITPAMSYEELAETDNKHRERYGEKYCRLTDLKPETCFMAYVIIA